jgi:RNA polymerase sigma factor (sigma-70 family)
VQDRSRVERSSHVATEGLRGNQGSEDDREAAAFVARAASRGAALDQLTALGAWQRQMERYPQLSPEQQAELVAQFQAGRAAQTQLDAGRRISASKERALRGDVRRGAQAMEMLAGSNFRLIHLIAREKAEERFGRDKATRILPDLIGEANVALVEAATVFDVGRGLSFSTYLAKVVRDKVLAVLSRQNMVKCPPSWTRVKRIYTVRYPRLAEELGRTPTLDEMKQDLLRVCMEWAAEHLTPTQQTRPAVEREEAMTERLRKQGMLGAIAKLEDVLAATQITGSTDTPVGDGDGTLGDLLMGDDGDPGTTIEQDELRQAVVDVLASLDPREREIVMYRYGFVDGESWTYAKISKQYGVSPERIRQIERATVAKLRLPHDHYRRLATFQDGD